MNRILRNSLASALVFALSFMAGCSSGEVTVTFSDKAGTVKLDPGDTLAEGLEDQGMNVPELKKKYKAPVSWDQPLSGGKVELRCNCKVSLHVAGKELGTFQTTAPTVRDFLKEKKVELTAWDELSSSPDAKITDGMTVVVDRYEQRIQKKVEKIPFNTKEEKDDQLAEGKKKVEKEGKEGKKIFQVVALFKNGEPVEENGEPVIEERLVETVKPVDKIVKIGTNKELAQKEKVNLAAVRTLTVQATGYTHTGNRTYMGTWPKRGTVAVDPSVIPLGTKLYIPGYGYGVAEDTGGAVDGLIIDLFFETRAEALKWGRRTVTIQILK
ncbi:3D domain-containing protein [Staphylospora marina]|uniref:3D domain-containing protein n=1 Tax=Staphylospora marina TaxID=2490858 RepID=UPI000F5BC6EA|nr:3D domain-containing protein [Staphylospora marina]